jgi:hypothetical protein
MAGGTAERRPRLEWKLRGKTERRGSPGFARADTADDGALHFVAVPAREIFRYGIERIRSQFSE